MGVRDRRIVDQHVEAAEFAANPLSRGGDRTAVRHVELQRMGVAVDRTGRFLAARQVARTDQDDEILRRQLLGDLQADPLIGARDQGDAFVLHGRLLPANCGQRRSAAL